MADIYRTYCQLVEHHRSSKSGPEAPGENMLRKIAKDDLLARISANAGAAQRSALTHRRARGARWHAAARQLGWGVLCLFPSLEITNRWVESTLRVHEW